MGRLGVTESGVDLRKWYREDDEGVPREPAVWHKGVMGGEDKGLGGRRPIATCGAPLVPTKGRSRTPRRGTGEICKVCVPGFRRRKGRKRPRRPDLARVRHVRVSVPAQEADEMTAAGVDLAELMKDAVHAAYERGRPYRPVELPTTSADAAADVRRWAELVVSSAYEIMPSYRTERGIPGSELRRHAMLSWSQLWAVMRQVGVRRQTGVHLHGRQQKVYLFGDLGRLEAWTKGDEAVR